MKQNRFTAANSRRLSEDMEKRIYDTSVIARLDRAIQRLILWIPRSSRRMTTEKKIYNRGTEDICAIY